MIADNHFVSAAKTELQLDGCADRGYGCELEGNEGYDNEDQDRKICQQYLGNPCFEDRGDNNDKDDRDIDRDRDREGPIYDVDERDNDTSDNFLGDVEGFFY
jgi:hypothetical protein